MYPILTLRDSLLTGGASGTIHFWDLYTPSLPYFPQDSRSSTTHEYGISCLSWWPFDTGAFLSSSYDYSLKLYATDTLTPSAKFELGAVIYHHAISPIADHVLVACATANSAVRLVDLKSGVTAQKLLGHDGAALSVAWSPRSEHLLASSGADGTVRLWDVRRSANCLGMLDLEDSESSLADPSGSGYYTAPKRAHVGPSNGVTWTDDGAYIVTVGHDERIRVWEADTGANTLAHFGAGVRNRTFACRNPVVVPCAVTGVGKRALVWGNEREVIIYELLEGRVITRLRSGRRPKEGLLAVGWRTGWGEVFAGWKDGFLKAWTARNEGDDEEELLDIEEKVDEQEERRKKRKAMEEMYKDLTRQKMTFT